MEYIRTFSPQIHMYEPRWRPPQRFLHYPTQHEFLLEPPVHWRVSCVVRYLPLQQHAAVAQDPLGPGVAG
jgi:hypothetical protein